jgi:hypothetical protein
MKRPVTGDYFRRRTFLLSGGKKENLSGTIRTGQKKKHRQQSLPKINMKTMFSIIKKGNWGIVQSMPLVYRRNLKAT